MLAGRRTGPAELVLVRHGESVGNLADAAARENKADRLDLSARDADVELTDRGLKQAAGVGRWLAQAEDDSRPELVLSSPYRRAAETARRAVEGLGLDVEYDERLRERDLGLFDGLTWQGIQAEYPDVAERRDKLGKFYYQPPSGESWCDVVLRVRSLLADLAHGYDGARVWMFSHQAVIMSFRYVLEGLDEEQLLEIDRTTKLPNASMTVFQRCDDTWKLERWADTSAVDDIAAEVTREAPQSGRGDDADA
jgi:broad specificity phosphatase PhoE